jgi:hypothetical protein
VRGRQRSECTLVRRFQLPEGIEWKTAIVVDDYFVAAGFQFETIAIVRANWNGVIQRPSKLDVSPINLSKPSRIFLGATLKYNQVLFACCCGRQIGKSFFRRDDGFSNHLQIADPFGGEWPIGFAYDPSGVRWTIHIKDHRLYLSSWHADHGVISSHAMPDLAHPISIQVARERIYISGGNNLRIFQDSENHSDIELPRPILSLAGSAPHSQQRVAAMMEEGAAMIWDDQSGAATELFAHDLVRPVGTFTPHGWFVAASQERVEVYRTKDHKLVYKAGAPGGASAPIAVLPADHADCFAVVDESGGVAIYRIPLGGT